MNSSIPLYRLWPWRGLIRQLVVRDLKVRYKVSVLGFFWSLLRPLLTLGVLALVFSMVEDLRSERYDVAYPVLLMAAYLPWFFFSSAILEGTQSLLANAHLIKKVYSPREVYPAAIVVSQAFNFLLAMLVLIPVLYLWSKATPTPWLLALPLVIAIHILFTLGLCLLLSVVNILLRDTTQIVEFVVFVWFYLSPVLYDFDIVHRQLGSSTGFLFYLLNPMAGILEGYRFTLLASQYDSSRLESTPDLWIVFGSVPYGAFVAVLTLVLGATILKRLESRAVDLL